MAKVRHYIQTEDFTADEYRQLVKKAEEFASNPESTFHLAEGKVISTMFFKESTRTAPIFQTAMQKMGGGWTGISGASGTYAASGEEDEEDMLRSVAPFANIMAIRHNYLDLNKFADNFPIPMVNAMVGGDEHTVCGLWYLYHLQKELGRFDNLKIGIIGQTKNCRPYKTLQKVLSMFNVEIFEDPIVDGLATPQHIVDFVEEHGGKYQKAKKEDFIGEVDYLVICDGMPSTKEDPALVEEYNQKFKTMTADDFKGLNEGAQFQYMMPRAMTDGRLTVAKEVDTDPRLDNAQFMADSLWPTMALINFLLDASK